MKDHRSKKSTNDACAVCYGATNATMIDTTILMPSKASEARDETTYWPVRAMPMYLQTSSENKMLSGNLSDPTN